MTISYEDLCSIATIAMGALRKNRDIFISNKKLSDAECAEKLYVKAHQISHFALANKCDIDISVMQNPDKYKYCICLKSQEEVDAVKTALHDQCITEKRRTEILRDVRDRMNAAYHEYIDTAD